MPYEEKYFQKMEDGKIEGEEEKNIKRLESSEQTILQQNISLVEFSVILFGPGTCKAFLSEGTNFFLRFEIVFSKISIFCFFVIILY